MNSDLVEYSKELHRPARKNFERRSVSTFHPDDIWAADLLDVSNISEDNDGVKFLLVVVDVYSRYAIVIKLKSKKAVDVLNTFKTFEMLPSNIWVDEGNEFFNKELKAYLKKK